ncbi:MAG: carbohydrate kinase family protein [Parcubacteria group bacterium]|nr:carbohydrate kinase family protein [Parcubacteria group bacterium]
MYDIITFGSATRDAFFYSPDFKILENKEFLSGRALALDLGSKVEIDDVVFTTGGGGTNTAVSFSGLGFSTTCVAQVGEDLSGKHIVEELNENNVDTSFIMKDEKEKTAYSVILSSKDEGRTILVHRGASSYINNEKINWDELKSKWFYIASTNGNFDLLNKIFEKAKENNTKIAFNPGSRELKDPKLKPLLEKTNILILNQEEAASLTDENIENEKEILESLNKKTSGIIVMTQGGNGVKVIDSDIIYNAPSLGEDGVERTGAGDAFGSGFVSGMIMENNIEYAMQLGSANATSVIQEIGAKNGLLKKQDLENFEKVEVNK